MGPVVGSKCCMQCTYIPSSTKLMTYLLHPPMATSEGTSEECFVSQVGLQWLIYELMMMVTLVFVVLQEEMMTMMHGLTYVGLK